MPRSPRNARLAEPTPQLNLAPIMNMVVILIPILLLSVVLLRSGVIDVSTPELGRAPAEAAAGEALELTVAVGAYGFKITTSAGPLESSGCARASVCLVRPIDLEAVFRRSREAFASGDVAAGESAVELAMASYDYAGLYSRLAELKRSHPDETTVRITADPDVPYAVVVRVMDALRHRLDEDAYADQVAFWSASARVARGRSVPLFDQPVLTIVR